MQECVETERVLLRRFSAADLDNLYRLLNDPAVMHFLNGGTHTPREVIAQDTLPQCCRAGYYERTWWRPVTARLHSRLTERRLVWGGKRF